MSASRLAVYEAKDEKKKIIHLGQAQVALWQSCGIGERHSMQDFDYLAKKVEWLAKYKIAKQVVFDGGLVILLGDRGNGKTQCAAAIMRDICFSNPPKAAKYYVAREVGMVLREPYSKNSQLTERQAVAKFIKPHFLVIDEAHERMDTDHERKNLNFIVDKRYRDVLPTLFIANCGPDQLIDLLGPSICDRSLEGGKRLLFDWKSYRGEK